MIIGTVRRTRDGVSAGGSVPAVSGMHDPSPSSRRSRAGSLLTLGPLLVAALLAALVLQTAFGNRRTNYEEMALQGIAESIYARHEGRPIHCKGVVDAGGCLDGVRERALPAVALWLGNSQLHAVMQKQPGDETAPWLLFGQFQQRDLDLLTFSQPNASLQEHYVLYSYLRDRLPIERLILALVFDDLRETGLRADIATALESPGTRDRLEGTAIGRRLLGEGETAQLAGGDLAGLNETFQESSERWLDDRLDRHLPLWRARPEARGALFLGLYRMRNTVFGSTPQTKRRLIRGRYESNLAALDALLAATNEDGVRSLVYIVPLRSDVDTPYDAEDYRRFKQDVEVRCRAAGAAFANLEELVPAEDWGLKQTTSMRGGVEIDFMHFRASGHARLASALGRLVDDTASEAVE